MTDKTATQDNHINYIRDLFNNYTGKYVFHMYIPQLHYLNDQETNQLISLMINNLSNNNQEYWLSSAHIISEMKLCKDKYSNIYAFVDQQLNILLQKE